MATTYTPNYNWAQPEVGGEPDTWGNLLNANIGALDTQLKAVSDVANAALPKSGGTLTGNLVVAPAAGSASYSATAASGSSSFLYLNNAAAGANHYVATRVNNNFRWAMNLGNATAESGGNAGSDFALERYTDAGALIGNALTISRATGVATLSARPTWAGLTPWDTGNFDPSAKANLSGATFTGAVSVPGLTASTLNVSARPTWAGLTPWDTGNFDPSAKANLSGAAFTGNISAAGRVTTLGTSAAFWMEDRGTANQWALYVNGNSARLASDSGAVDRMSISGTGVVTAADFSATSDARLKTKVEPIHDAIAKLRDIQGKLYVKEGRREAGVIAQDVKRAFPVAVHAREDGMLTVSHGQLQALVIAALHELEERVSALELL